MRYDNSTPASFGVITTVSEELTTQQQAEDLLPLVAGFMYAPVATFDGQEIRAFSRAVASGEWPEALKMFQDEVQRLNAKGFRVIFYTVRASIGIDGSAAHIMRYAVV